MGEIGLALGRALGRGWEKVAQQKFGSAVGQVPNTAPCLPRDAGGGGGEGLRAPLVALRDA